MRSDHVKNVPKLWILHDSLNCVFDNLRTHQFEYAQLAPLNVLGLFSDLCRGYFEKFGDFLFEVMLLTFKIFFVESKTDLPVGSSFFLQSDGFILCVVIIKIVQDFD